MKGDRFVAWLNRSSGRRGLVFVDPEADVAVRWWMWSIRRGVRA